MNGERAKKRSRVDAQWWGKRPMSGTFLSFNRGMSKQKRLLHKIERRNGKMNESSSAQAWELEVIAIDNGTHAK